MTFFGILGLAWEGLRRKKGRNGLTMLGIVIAILSLSLVVSAGEGMDRFLSAELKQEENMRQVAVNPGFGRDIGDFFDEVKVEGAMSEAKRRRLERAIRNRRRPHPRSGRKSRIIDEKALAWLRSLPRVEEVKPVVLERYDVACGGKASQAVASYALSAGSPRHARRLIAGSYFSSEDAAEVLVHEHLLYTWGVPSDEEQARWVGREMRLTPRRGEGGGLLEAFQGLGGAQGAPLPLGSLLGGVDITPEEQRVILGLAQKVMRRGAEAAAEEPETYSVRIAGVVRDYEPSDGAFNILEDGNSLTADLFLPRGFARRLFLASPFNLSQGYTRAIVVADSPEGAQEIQKVVQKEGFLAVSVGVILEQVNTVLTGLTIFQSFLTGIILVVAGLGIMTTMITSVVERTREIGIWKAVGASNGQVLAVFLAESAIVGLAGSVVGLVLARLLMLPGNVLGRHIIEAQTSMPFGGEVLVLPLWAAVAAPLFATFIAVLAAVYPALRGARIDPVKALRHD